MQRYLPRIYDEVLDRRLRAKGAVLVEGAKWCGKTTTAEQHANSVLLMQDPDSRDQNLLLADIRPSELLKGAPPRLIDEWQIAPKLWDAVRFEVDRRDEFGQFILTDSAVPAQKEEESHTGTGRIVRMRMRTMSLFESEESIGAVSLNELFREGSAPVSTCGTTIEQVAFLTCRGGWPKAVGQPEDIALQQAFDYLDAVTQTDVSRVDGVERDPYKARALLRSYARMIGSQTPVETIEDDLKGSDSMSINTVHSYLKALRRIFVIEDMPAWNPNLRSKAAIRTSPTRHFVDPSIATAALGIGPANLIADLRTFGLLFEGLCIRDLRVYADALDGEVFHFRDSNGLECDAVVHLRDGSYGLVEVKLGGERLIEDGAKTLLKLKGKIDTDKMNPPSFLMVLTGTTPYSYCREDGVCVVPIGCLRP